MSEQPRTTPGRVAAEVGAWWVVATGLWCVFVSTISVSEVLAGAAAGLIAAAAAGHLRVIGWPDHSADLRWLRRAARIPVEAVRDTAMLARLLVAHVAGRRLHGELRTVPLAGPGTSARARGNRALATLALNSTPGAYVVSDYDDGTARVHVVGDRDDITGWLRS